MAVSVGFTGTRRGMATAQKFVVFDLLYKIDAEFDEPIVVHHGCCVGADEEFAEKCDSIGFEVIGHPPRILAFRSTRGVELSIELREPAHYSVRNQAIVDASTVMIAAPAEPEPQRAGGTWMTIRMALRAQRAGKLIRLHVIAPDGSELDHSRWAA